MSTCVECSDPIDEPTETAPYCAFCRRLRMPAPDVSFPSAATVREAQRAAGLR